MNLKYDNEYSLFDENDILVAGEGTTFKIIGFESSNSSVIMKAVQLWDGNPGILPKGTTFEFVFHNAILRNNLPGRSVKDIVDKLEIMGRGPMYPKDKIDPGYKFSVLFYENDQSAWELLYNVSEVTARLP
ncbi:hypothetical protein HGB24_03360 [Candidatus Saccharibacteria bacterium]|nr:hypothetical protein [Candidatus Saccharibacteria bacterium]